MHEGGNQHVDQRSRSGFSGTHVNNPAVEYYKAQELIWEPTSSCGMLSVDGELVACGDETSGLLPAMHRGSRLPLAYSKAHMKVKQGLLRAFTVS